MFGSKKKLEERIAAIEEINNSHGRTIANLVKSSDRQCKNIDDLTGIVEKNTDEIKKILKGLTTTNEHGVMLVEQINKLKDYCYELNAESTELKSGLKKVSDLSGDLSALDALYVDKGVQIKLIKIWLTILTGVTLLCLIF